MKQSVLNHSQNRLSASFQQISAGLSLVVISSATADYFTQMWPMRPIALANDVMPDGYGMLVLSTVTLIIVAQIVLQAMLAIGARSAPAANDHERTAVLKAKRNAYAVLTAGVLAAIGTIFMQELTPFCTANVAILALLAAEMVRYASQLFYGRQTP